MSTNVALESKVEQPATHLHVREAGPRGAPAIVFLHGSPLSGRMWQPEFDLLRDLHLIAPDLPGHGSSAEVPLTTLRDVAEKVAVIIRRSVPEGRAHVVGLSYGGAVAQGLMVHFPEVVDHVILSGAPTRLPDWLLWLGGLNEPVLRVFKPEQLARIISLQFGVPSRFLDLLREDLQSFSSRTLLSVLKTYAEIEMPSAFRSPVLVSVGQKENFIAKSSARKLTREIPGARGVMAPGGGHVWSMGKPELFSQMVRAWIAAEPLPALLGPL